MLEGTVWLSLANHLVSLRISQLQANLLQKNLMICVVMHCNK